MSGNSCTVAGSVFSALYAGITTAIRFPLSMADYGSRVSVRFAPEHWDTLIINHVLKRFRPQKDSGSDQRHSTHSRRLPAYRDRDDLYWPHAADSVGALVTHRCPIWLAD